jgi:hypothetical protein
MGIDFSKLSPSQLNVANKIVAEANGQGVDPNLALAVAYQESRFNHFTGDKVTQGPQTRYGRATGVMQLIPDTAKSYKVDANDLDQNIRGGVSVLRDHLKNFGNPVDALIAYNWGSGNAKKFYETRDMNLLPKETRNYVSNINTMIGLPGAEAYAAPPKPPEGAPMADKIAWEKQYGSTVVAPTPPSSGVGTADLFTQGLGAVGGASAGAATGFLGSGGVRNMFPSLRQGLTGSIDVPNETIGPPLKKYELAAPEGQALEKARRELNTRMDALRSFGTGQEMSRTNLAAQLAELEGNLPAQQAAARAAQQAFVELGGVQAPQFRAPSAPVTGGAVNPNAPNILSQAYGATPKVGESFSGFGKAHNQHIIEEFMKQNKLQEMARLNDLAERGATASPYAQKFVGSGLHLFGPESTILTRPNVIAGDVAPSVLPVDDAAARARTAEAERRAAAEQLARNQQYAQAQQAARESRRALEATTTGIDRTRSGLTNLTAEMPIAMRPYVDRQTAADINYRAARTAMPSKLNLTLGRMAPVLGGAAMGIDTGLMGAEALARQQAGDPIGATIAGLGAGAGAVGMYPTLPTRAIGFLGSLASLGALYGYDKFSPEILNLLKSKGLIDPNYGSVMR